jgi:GAF domain-containing protein
MKLADLPAICAFRYQQWIGKDMEKAAGSLIHWRNRPVPTAMQPEKARILLLGLNLFVPLPGRQRLAGWVAIGTRISGEPYSARELSFVESLCDQTAVAIERAQVVHQYGKPGA